ncbi:MAG TPA: glycerol-3-phosphate 1-O-acyltransferase PlsY, partial [Halanaerobiales bacterium]|nr:glycerol-3-phosphate 1-O-acyltransferase PlsY [Halanaerobiales bacterium]
NGYIFGMRFAGKDIRNFGSGNVGATNVARVAGYKVGLLVAILDIAKGYVAVLIAQYFLLPEYSMVFVFAAVLLAIIGHNWSVFLSFKGGKGVATSVGIILRLFPYSLLILVIVWIVMILLTKMVSVGSILGAISLPISVAFLYSTDSSYIIFSTIITLLVIFSHRSNIKRIIKGNENKMSWPPGKE